MVDKGGARGPVAPGAFQQCSARLERSDTLFRIDVGFGMAAAAFGGQLAGCQQG